MEDRMCVHRVWPIISCAGERVRLSSEFSRFATRAFVVSPNENDNKFDGHIESVYRVRGK